MSLPSPNPARAAASSDLFETLRQLRTAMLATGVFSIVLSLLLLAPSIYMLQVYDRVLGSRNEMTLLMLTLLILGLYALYGLMEFARSSILVRVSRAMDELLSLRVFEAASREAALTHSGNPSQAMHDLLALRQFVSGTGLILFFDAPLAVIFLAAAFAVDVWLGVFMVASCIVLASLAWWNERRTHQPLQEANQLNARAASYMNNSFRNTEVIQAMGMLPAVAARWQRMSRVALERQEEASIAGAQVGALTKSMRLLSQSLALGLGALLVLEGRMSPGLMVASSILLGRALSPIEMMIASWRQVVGAREAYGRLDRLLGNVVKADAGMELPQPQGRLQVEQVAVAVPGGKTPLVRGLQFAVEPGRVLTIIGPSGAGKSTVARVLAGVWQPLAGTVRLDGADLLSWPRERLAPYVGFLPQDVELFEGTVAENIARLQEPDAEKVVKAAQQAGVHELILRLPQGYDTPLGPSGAALSGGQRQRVALARALYGEPKLLVLDEPNSSLDDAGEAALAQAIAACRAAGTTVILISHKTATLRVTDYILLMRDGVQVAFGPRDRVLAELQQQQQQQQQPPSRPAPQAGPALPQQRAAAPAAETVTPA